MLFKTGFVGKESILDVYNNFLKNVLILVGLLFVQCFKFLLPNSTNSIKYRWR